MSGPCWCVTTDTGEQGYVSADTASLAAQSFLDALTQAERDAVTQVDVSPPTQKQVILDVSGGTVS